MSIGSNIRKRRFELNMSQQELSEKMGYKDRSTIAKIESDKNEVSHSKLLLFARALDTTVEYLTNGVLNYNYPQEDVSVDPNKKNHNIAVILAGGDSSHNRQKIPNQFIDVLGKPIFMYACETYQHHPAIDAIYVVCLKGWENIVTAYAQQFHITKLKVIIPGGKTGIQSIHNAVKEIQKKFKDNDTVIFHESTRPLISSETISRLLNFCEKHNSAITCAPMEDYMQFLLNDKGQEYIDRYHIVSVQSPDAHKLCTLKQAFENNKKTQGRLQESCLALFLHNLGQKLHFLEGPHSNIKIFRQEDIVIFAGLLKTHMY